MSASRLLLFILLPAVALAEGPPVEQPGIDLGRAAAQLEGEPAAEPPAAAPGDQAAPAAAAPGADQAAPAAAAPGADQAAPVAAAPGAVAAAPAADQAALAGDAYTVKPGDTLWDLSGRFLNNPWYWPKVWSYNPEIANPHFIYPGNVVRFVPGADEAPGRVEPMGIASAQPPAPESDEDLSAPHELEDLSRADMKKPQEIGEGDEVAVVGPYKVGYVAPKGIHARRDSFITVRELEESGTIKAAFDEKQYLSLNDRAYARFSVPAQVKTGEQYLLFRTERPVRHPVTGELFGYQSTIIGAARVVAVNEKVATIEIAQAYDPIERGTMLAPLTQKVVRQVQRRPNQHALAGVIVAAQQEIVSEIGEHHMVFVDKGRADGVEEGNVFTVVRAGDPWREHVQGGATDPSLPQEDVGTLLVVDAQQNTSAALVVRSLRELSIGERVLMRTAAADAPVAGSGGR